MTSPKSYKSYSTSIPSLARILASDSIEPICAKVFKDRGHELVEKPGIKKDDLLKIIHEYDGIVVRSATKVTKEIIEAGHNLKMIGRAGTGVDNIDVVIVVIAAIRCKPRKNYVNRSNIYHKVANFT